MADTGEKKFQQNIVDYLQAHGWLVGDPKDDKYDRNRAIYLDDLVGYFREAHPENWERFCKNHSRNPDEALADAVVRELKQQGTLNVLRHGFRVPGARIRLCTFKPDHGMNPETLAQYGANRLRVVPEVSYSPHKKKGTYDPRLDLVLFVNGIPTATIELKSEFKQSIESAKRQYMRDRPLKDPIDRKEEPLLKFNRGALVHFVVTQSEVAMTTRLNGAATYFLPFNQGTPDGGAGNPPPPDADTYAVAYLWEKVFQRDAWLNILSRFLHLEKKETETFDGKLKVEKTLIFPRYHQWEAVNKLLEATRKEGPGSRYLIQHSAGSGKSNSIAWAAYQLSSLYNAEGERIFDSVIVITDRTVLDSQLQKTIYEFQRTDGVVQHIDGFQGRASKSEQLAEALAKGTRIIIVTIQTFPALFEALDRYPALAEKRYAVIADEAHSSQSGAAASKLKAVLLADTPEGEELTAEEKLNAMVAARKPSDRISYYAFTATPKAKTLELFGRLPRPDEPKGDDNKPEPFHLYSMRQAIEEKFILDVLRNYVTYNTAWKLGSAHAEDEEVDTRKASTRLARWVRLHEYNINQKVEVIVEHFRSKVAHLLNGQAKAMVVTGSRQEVVRYKLAMDKYIRERGYNNVLPLVAFSGSVLPDDVIPEEVTETHRLMNPDLCGRDLADAFDTQDYNLMLAANKFQTGFNQPKLCAMYVDKKLKDVDCVQTLSRLNRTFDGKTTFILDFVNDPEEVRKAFEPYYNKAELLDVSDPQVVFDLQRKLDEMRIYRWEEVDAFANAFYSSKTKDEALSYYCAPAQERFKLRYEEVSAEIQRLQQERRQAQESGNKVGQEQAEHALKEAGARREALHLFRKNLGSFIRTYEFLSQIIDYNDQQLERFLVYARELLRLLFNLGFGKTEDDEIDLSGLSLTHYRITKKAELQIRLGEDGKDYGLKPISEVGSAQARDPKKEKLSEIITRLNDLFGAETGDEDKILSFANGITDRVERDERVMEQIRNNPPEQVMHGRFLHALRDFVLDDLELHEALASKALETDANLENFGFTILRLLAERAKDPDAFRAGSL